MSFYRFIKQSAVVWCIAVFCLTIGFYCGVFFCPEPAPKESDLFYAYCKRIVAFIEYHQWLYGELPDCKVFEGGLNKTISCEYADNGHSVFVILRSMQNGGLVYRAPLLGCPPKSKSIQMNTNNVFAPRFWQLQSQDVADIGKIASNKNAIMDDLLACEDIPTGYAAAMEALYRDKNQEKFADPAPASRPSSSAERSVSPPPNRPSAPSPPTTPPTQPSASPLGTPFPP